MSARMEATRHEARRRIYRALALALANIRAALVEVETLLKRLEEGEP